MGNKNIVLCSDGTGNRDIKARGTNVFKLYEAVDIQGHKENQSFKPQVAFYDDGVGSSSFLPVKIIGGNDVGASKAGAVAVFVMVSALLGPAELVTMI